VKRRRIIGLVVGCVVVGAIMAAIAFREREPTYHGVSLTGWLCAYDSIAPAGSSSPKRDPASLSRG
jgi:hypothetical protein